MRQRAHCLQIWGPVVQSFISEISCLTVVVSLSCLVVSWAACPYRPLGLPIPQQVWGWPRISQPWIAGGTSGHCKHVRPAGEDKSLDYLVAHVRFLSFISLFLDTLLLNMHILISSFA